VSDLLDAGGTIEDLMEIDPQERLHPPTTDATPGGGDPSAAEFFDSSGGLVVPRISDIIRLRGHLRHGVDRRLYRYVGGVYRGDGDGFVRSQVRTLLCERVKRRHIDEVLAYIGTFEDMILEWPPAHLVNIANGLLDWETERLHPHSPDVPSCIQLPVRWNPLATCPRIETFLSEVLPWDAIEFALELIGYAIYTGNPLRIAVLLLGPGCNGKSVLLSILKALLGAQNVAAIPLQLLAEHRFAAAELLDGWRTSAAISTPGPSNRQICSR
jgi:hypothetical protein